MIDIKSIDVKEYITRLYIHHSGVTASSINEDTKLGEYFPFVGTDIVLYLGTPVQIGFETTLGQLISQVLEQQQFEIEWYKSRASFS